MDNTRQRVVDIRVLAYKNLQDGRPWGFDIYMCPGCEYGRKRLQAKMKLSCPSCGFTRRGIACPKWVYLARGEKLWEGAVQVTAVSRTCE